MDNANATTTTNAVTWPLERTSDNPLTITEIMDALNSLHSRLSAIETTAPVDAVEFSAADRAVLNEVRGFLGIHSAVANTVAGNVEVAKPVEVRPQFGNTETALTGA